MATATKVIRFDRLVGTKAVSVTGRACGSNCAHCGGYYLRTMWTPDQARKAAREELERRAASTFPRAGAAAGGADRAGGAGPVDAAPPRAGGHPPIRSWLVSGGCGRDGRVPLLRGEDLLEELGRVGPLNLHAGLVRDDEEARAIGRLASVVSFDFTVDTATIREVYGFPGVSGEQFAKSFGLLHRHARVTPHVLIGLSGGHVRGEAEALRELRRQGVERVVLLVLIPTKGSRFEGASLPPLADVERVIGLAVELFGAGAGLGCMRPKGAYRASLDVAAVRAGVGRIAVPTPAAVREAERLGLEAVWSEECCAFEREGRP